MITAAVHGGLTRARARAHSPQIDDAEQDTPETKSLVTVKQMGSVLRALWASSTTVLRVGEAGGDPVYELYHRPGGRRAGQLSVDAVARRTLRLATLPPGLSSSTLMTAWRRVRDAADDAEFERLLADFLAAQRHGRKSWVTRVREGHSWSKRAFWREMIGFLASELAKPGVLSLQIVLRRLRTWGGVDVSDATMLYHARRVGSLVIDRMERRRRDDTLHKRVAGQYTMYMFDFVKRVQFAWSCGQVHRHVLELEATNPDDPFLNRFRVPPSGATLQAWNEGKWMDYPNMPFALMMGASTFDGTNSLTCRPLGKRLERTVTVATDAKPAGMGGIGGGLTNAGVVAALFPEKEQFKYSYFEVADTLMPDFSTVTTILGGGSAYSLAGIDMKTDMLRRLPGPAAEHCSCTYTPPEFDGPHLPAGQELMNAFWHQRDTGRMRGEEALMFTRVLAMFLGAGRCSPRVRIIDAGGYQCGRDNVAEERRVGIYRVQVEEGGTPFCMPPDVTSNANIDARFVQGVALLRANQGQTNAVVATLRNVMMDVNLGNDPIWRNGTAWRCLGLAPPKDTTSESPTLTWPGQAQYERIARKGRGMVDSGWPTTAASMRRLDVLIHTPRELVRPPGTLPVELADRIRRAAEGAAAEGGAAAAAAAALPRRDAAAPSQPLSAEDEALLERLRRLQEEQVRAETAYRVAAAERERVSREVTKLQAELARRRLARGAALTGVDASAVLEETPRLAARIRSRADVPAEVTDWLDLTAAAYFAEVPNTETPPARPLVAPRAAAADSDSDSPPKASSAGGGRRQGKRAAKRRPQESKRRRKGEEEEGSADDASTSSADSAPPPVVDTLAATRSRRSTAGRRALTWDDYESDDWDSMDGGGGGGGGGGSADDGDEYDAADDDA